MEGARQGGSPSSGSHKRGDDRALPGPVAAPHIAETVSQANVVPRIRAAAAADRDEFVNDRRPRVKVWQVFVDGSSADVAMVFLREYPGAEQASAVPVGVARVARHRAGFPARPSRATWQSGQRRAPGGQTALTRTGQTVAGRGWRSVIRWSPSLTAAHCCPLLPPQCPGDCCPAAPL
jgi:hypothetical protein